MKELITIEMYRGNLPLTADLELNARELLTKVNSLLQALGVKRAYMTSGYRSPDHNLAIGGAPGSKHTTAQAIDLEDNDRAIGNRLLTLPKLLCDRGMAIEDLRYCERLNGQKWVHLQSCLPKSGKNIFIPYCGPIKLV